MFYLYHDTRPNLVPLDRAPTQEELAAFALAGLRLCRVGRAYTRTITSSCVNGESYAYFGRELLTQQGGFICHVEVTK